MRSPIFLLLACPLIVPAQAPAPEPSLRTTTSEVLLDVVVRDKHAQIIRDLRPDEVKVFEDGVPQKLRHFEFVDGHTSTSYEPGSPKALSSMSVRNAVTPPAKSAGRVSVNELRDSTVISIVIADLDPRGRKLTLDATRKFVKTELQPNMYMGVFSLGISGLQFLQPYTNDGEKISAAVERGTSAALVGQLTAVNQLSMQEGGPGTADITSGEISDPSVDPGTVSGATAAISGPAAAISNMMATHWASEMQDVYADSMRYLTPLRTLVQAQAEIPGRKVVLLFSAGLPVHIDTVELLQSVISTANRANVSIYAVDTRGITPQSTLDQSRRMLRAAANASMRQQLMKVNGGDQTVTPDMVLASEMGEAAIHLDNRANLMEMAEGTGGELLPDSLDLLEPLRHAVEDVRTHYELTYSPADSAMDGSFRRIEVKVSRPGARVFARSGYFALPTLNGQQIYPFELETMKALNAKPMLHPFDFRVAVLQFRPGMERSQMDFAFEVPVSGLKLTKDGQWVKIHVDVTALVKNERGQVVQKISKDIPDNERASVQAKLEHAVVSFSTPFMLPAGHYTLETAALDRGSMRASVSHSAFDVTDETGFSMSDVAIARRVDAIQAPTNNFDPLDARGGAITPELWENVTPDADGNITFYAVAYPPAPVNAPVNASLEIWRGVQLVMRSIGTTVPLDTKGAASILASVHTRKLPPGSYKAQVSFEYKGQKIARTVPFALSAGF